MGIACIGAYDAREDRYRVFTDGNLEEFAELAAKRFVIGFNSIAFDDVVCGHCGVPVKTDWDLLQETWVAAGLGREFVYPSHAGYGLDALAKANGFGGKTGYGGYAPVDWQRGFYGKTIDYCLEDVRQTWMLVQMVISIGWLNHPRMAGRLTFDPTPLIEQIGAEKD